MSIPAKLRKHVHPILKAQGFQKLGGWWMKEEAGDWRTFVEARAAKMQDPSEYIIEIDIGFFSLRVDELMGWSEKARIVTKGPPKTPAGIFLCHFWSSLFDLNNDGEWTSISQNVFLRDSDQVSDALAGIAEKLDTVVPKAFDKYASFESLIECVRTNVGRSAQSNDAKLFAAAACIMLNRYDEAQDFLERGVRPGSPQFQKDVGEKLRSMIKEKEG